MNKSRQFINLIFNKIISIMIVAIVLFINLFIFPINKVNAATYNQTIINANSNNNNGIDAFPETYKVLLNKLVQETGHTNWKFKAYYTDIDWNELSKAENACLKNTIYSKSQPTYSVSTWFCRINQQHLDNGNCGDGYYCPSPKLVNYYLDPRNFLTEVTIFQFLDLNLYGEPETVELIEKAVAGTILDKTSPEGERYAQLIYDASKASGEKPLSIVARIFQEIGPKNFTSKMITGTDKDYPNTYNFFNWGATDGSGAQLRGLKAANALGWNSPRTALVEGAKLVAKSYTKAGQETKYEYKFNVGTNKTFSHQYMSNLQDATNQSKLMYDAYTAASVNTNLLNSEFTFIIPVYKNMPAYNKLPSSFEGSEIYYISSNYTSPNLRDGIGTNANKITEIKKDTLVTMVQLNAGTDKYGVQWHKIKLENGTEGYMTSEYLTKVNNTIDTYKVPNQPAEEKPETPEQPNEPSQPENPEINVPTENANFKVVENVIITEPKTVISNIKTKYTVISATKDGNAVGDNAVLSTGTIIKTNQGEYTVAKLGDANGSGIVDSLDALKILKYDVGATTMNEVYLKAADANKNGVVDSLDALKILKFDVNLTDITI